MGVALLCLEWPPFLYFHLPLFSFVLTPGSQYYSWDFPKAPLASPIPRIHPPLQATLPGSQIQSEVGGGVLEPQRARWSQVQKREHWAPLGPSWTNDDVNSRSWSLRAELSYVDSFVMLTKVLSVGHNSSPPPPILQRRKPDQELAKAHSCERAQIQT